MFRCRMGFGGVFFCKSVILNVRKAWGFQVFWLECIRLGEHMLLPLVGIGVRMVMR